MGPRPPAATAVAVGCGVVRPHGGGRNSPIIINARGDVPCTVTHGEITDVVGGMHVIVLIHFTGDVISTTNA